ncbi:Acg family FMN-binding oxidoreductase [Catenuloplanes indicus]|uniref:Nitroreductase n=1 Tax=Catenuloplanes indicus TaxID=137267 RepID=A0AAE3W7L8_9ACTN|nr:nitroreductase family protein [Catenuloplanes indicus]MDQ0370782.1 nitroreductase [Catenuloplanes indicus]
MTSQTTRTAATVLAEAAATAGFAPSVHNTQPWRWRVLPDALELYAVPERKVLSIDPAGRLLTVSVGAALHHAVVALEALGLTASVERFDGPELLARITPSAPCEVTPAAMRRVQHLRTRRTDRRPTRDEAVAPADLTALQRIVADHGVQLHLLVDDQVYELAAAAGRAVEVAVRDPFVQHELDFWKAKTLPAESLPETPVQSTVPNRDFGEHGRLPIGEGHDNFASYGVIFGPDDEPRTWLRAGEALSAAWLAAAERGIGVLPLSGVIEVDVTRTALRMTLAELGYPYLVVRLGLPDTEHAGPPATPRMPAAQLIDTSAVR